LPNYSGILFINEFLADKDAEQGQLHADFKLGGGGEIGLFAAEGKTLIDSIVFGE